jgi:hypothetical protein
LRQAFRAQAPGECHTIPLGRRERRQGHWRQATFCDGAYEATRRERRIDEQMHGYGTRGLFTAEANVQQAAITVRSANFGISAALAQSIARRA